MPSGSTARYMSSRYEQAIGAVNEWLQTFGDSVRKLNDLELSAYTSRRFSDGWRLKVEFAGQTREFELFVDAEFPRERPHVRLVGENVFLKWPHVEEHDFLCLHPDSTAFNPHKPTEIVQATLADACSLIERSSRNSNQHEFYDEALSYWAKNVSDRAINVLSLINPAPPSRLVSVWMGRTFTLVGDDEPRVLQWLRHRFQKQDDRSTDKAVFLWLEEPLLPAQYPKTASDIIDLASRCGPEAVHLLNDVAGEEFDNVLVVLAFLTESGPFLFAVTIPAPVSGGYSATRTNISDGFRPGHVPTNLLLHRCFGSAPVSRLLVQRADSRWVHGRDHNEHLQQLQDATVTVIGCGSLGAPVAVQLAQSGVGRLVLIDPDSLRAANAERHPLGLTDIGKAKSMQLASLIEKRFPHIEDVCAREKRWQEVAAESEELLIESDLIVSATGSWGADGALNEWHIQHGRKSPVVYCWVEPFACAGHTVVIAATGGCLQCGFQEDGKCIRRVAEWPESTLVSEPACGVTFQPYGASQLEYVVALSSEMVIDCLLGRISTSVHRVWIGSEAYLESVGGNWAASWSDKLEPRTSHGSVEHEEWDCASECPECKVASK